MMAKASGGGRSSGRTGAKIQTRPELNFEYKNPNTHEVAIDHIELHEYNDLSKPLHGVFHGDSKAMVKEA
jgi:hypothetical protein